MNVEYPPPGEAARIGLEMINQPLRMHVPAGWLQQDDACNECGCQGFRLSDGLCDGCFEWIHPAADYRTARAQRQAALTDEQRQTYERAYHDAGRAMDLAELAYAASWTTEAGPG